jgi:hypothetical protein
MSNLIVCADTILMAGNSVSCVSIQKWRGTWYAQRITHLPPMLGDVVNLPTEDGSGTEEVFFDFFAMHADSLSMGDFGNLFGDALGNGRAAA